MHTMQTSELAKLTTLEHLLEHGEGDLLPESMAMRWRRARQDL